MKTNKLMKRAALGVMFAFITTTTFAGDGDKPTGKVSINQYLDTEYSIISVSNHADKNATFSIKDANGLTVYKEWVNKAGIEQKILDFSNIEDGIYTATLKAKGQKEVAKTFIIENHQLIGAKKEVKVSDISLDSFFNISDNTLTVSHLSFGSKNFNISILNASGSELFEKEFAGNSAYSGKFDISALPNGDYTVSINSGKKEYSYAFRK